MSDARSVQITEIDDERSPLASAAVALVEQTFDPRDRHASDELRSEIEEKRLGLIAPFNFHLLAARENDVLLGAAIGSYLAVVNAGFISYVAVAAARRGGGTGRLLRRELVTHFRADAKRAGFDDLTWVLGEVRKTNPWLRRLVRRRGAIPFDLAYYHPGMLPGPALSPYVLYRQPVTDTRIDLPPDLVRRLLYAIYRRAYRVRYPLQHEGFRAMLVQLQDRDMVGAHPEFEYPDSAQDVEVPDEVPDEVPKRSS